MTLDDLEQLEQKRLKASPGPWCSDTVSYVWASDGSGVAECIQGPSDAAYIAALSPEVVGEVIRLAKIGHATELRQAAEPCGCEIYETCAKCRGEEPRS